MKWIFLSKGGVDEYINLFAQGARQAPTVLESWDYNSSRDPLVLRGILKHKIYKRCWADGRPFLYMDTGYFGNRPNPLNPHGWKVWHRVVPDNIQHSDIIERPADRWEKLGIRPEPRKKTGSKILIAAPDVKPCQVYGIELQQWLDDTINKIKQHTDRPVEIRQRDPNRQRRLANDFSTALQDVHAVVTYNSNAAVEAVLCGVPVFIGAPVSAALPVGNRDLGKIDDPWFPDPDLVQAWCRHLAYGQFHNNELGNGTAEAIIRQEWPK
jgi:hypothetical protein